MANGADNCNLLLTNQKQIPRMNRIAIRETLCHQAAHKVSDLP
jgi:hypothetical protein